MHYLFLSFFIKKKRIKAGVNWYQLYTFISVVVSVELSMK